VAALEETVEGVLRPVADLVTPERVNAIEQGAYDAQSRIAALEARVAKLEAVAAEALHKANAVLDSRIWKALVKGSDLLLRVTGRSGR
jgi:BMFP domain-containing protein YqiC